MGSAAKTYVFYADVYFIQNFMIKITVLYLMYLGDKKLERMMSQGKFGRICIAGAMGTCFEIAVLLSKLPYHFFMLLQFFIEVPLMIVFVFGRSKGHIGKLMISSYILTMMLNAVLEAMWNIFGRKGSYIGFLFLASILTVVGVYMAKKEQKLRKGVYEVTLMQDERKMVIQGFYDSGNRLVDPYTQKGVHIIAEELIGELHIKVNRNVLIPYQSLGNEKGMIEVYYVDKVCICGEKGITEQMKHPIGVAKDNLFKGKIYKMILNEEVF